MDDPWADPWGEASAKTQSQGKPPLPTWDPLSTAAPDHIQPNLQTEMPSWEPKGTDAWTPSPDPAASGWGGDDQLSWTTTSLPLNDVVSETPNLKSLDPNVTEEDLVEHDRDVTATATPGDTSLHSPGIAPVDLSPPFLAPVVPPPLQSPNLALDGFGGFETGPDSASGDADGWSPSPGGFIEVKDDVWKNSWEAPRVDQSDGEQQDEWETARQRQEEQDRHVVRSSTHWIASFVN